MHLGLDRVIGAWSRDGVIIDPGPSSTVETLLAGIEGGEPRAILLTHIHLDHAGATGTLVARFPTCPSTCTRSARPTSSTPRACCAAPAGSTAIGWTSSGRGAGRSRGQHHGIARRRADRGAGGDRDPRPRLPSRLLFRPRRRRCVRWGRRRRPGSTERHGVAADSASGYRRRALAPVDRDDRRPRAGAAVAHPLRPDRGSASTSGGRRGGVAEESPRAPGLATAMRSWPTSSAGSTARPRSSPPGSARRCRRS